MESAPSLFGLPAGGRAWTSSGGGLIRTLSVGILAVAAVAASLIFTRARERIPAFEGGVPAGESLPAHGSLDALRAAGL